MKTTFLALVLVASLPALGASALERKPHPRPEDRLLSAHTDGRLRYDDRRPAWAPAAPVVPPNDRPDSANGS